MKLKGICFAIVMCLIFCVAALAEEVAAKKISGQVDGNYTYDTREFTRLERFI